MVHFKYGLELAMRSRAATVMERPSVCAIVNNLRLSIRASHLPLLSALLLITAGLLVYSQTRAYAHDEGFHLLAAQLIANGKRPYLDFFFPQTPLNAYWTAMWMSLSGQTWRTAHVLAALEAAGAVVLASDYVYRRLPEPRWRTLAALFVACSVGMNVVVIEFGTVGQAYGFCLFLSVAAFRAAIAAVDRPGLWLAALAGFLSCASASSSLLTAPVAPVLLIWMLRMNRAGSRVVKLAAFVAGVLIASAPVLWLFMQSPGPVIFGIVKYNLLYRQVEWSSWRVHDFGVALGWSDSSQALMLTLLAGGGLLFIRRSLWDQPRKAEFHLCAWTAVAETLYLLNVHPMFDRYFIFTVPFLAILAAVGVCYYGERLSLAGRPHGAVAATCFLIAAGVMSMLYETRDDWGWSDMEAIGAKVNEVTSPGTQLYAEESIYVVTRRLPPPGMNCANSHKVTWLQPAEAAALHVLPAPELDRLVKAKTFSTVEICDDDEIKRLGLEQIYSNKATASGECAVFWGRKTAP
jgi:hypothetical protein